MLRRKKVWPEKRGKQRGMRNQGCEGQVDPCSRACSLPELSRWQAAPCLGDFRHPASPRTLPRNLSFRSLEIPSLSALPTLSRIPPSRSPLFLSSPFLSSPPVLLSSFLSVGSRPSRPKEVVDRRRKEISRAISRLRHATTRTRPRAYTRAHTRALPVNAPPMCAAVVPINRREILIGMGCFQSRPALSAPAALRAAARPDASRFRAARRREIAGN